MSNRKHIINEIVSGWLRKKKGRPLRILETHQGLGIATNMYRHYGCVISFENDYNVYYQMRSKFLDAISLDLFLQQGQSLLEFIELCGVRQKYPVIIPDKPTDSRLGIVKLSEYGFKFDIVDVDPYGSPHEFIPNTFDLLDDRSILLITTGEMHYVRFRPLHAMAPYDIQANKSLRTTRSFFKDDNVLVIGASVVQGGLEKSMGVYPIFIYDYYEAQSGVQRIGFWVRKQIGRIRKISLKDCLFYDPLLGTYMIRCSVERRNAKGTKIWRFNRNCPEEEIENYILECLDTYINLH